MKPPLILIIAGPNGSGKTTFAREYLPVDAGFPHFINADLIAEGISPFDPGQAAFQAGRIMLAEIDRLAEEKASFAFETTLSGRIWSQRIPRWRRDGYMVDILFLGLPNPEFAIDRVANRVSQGGHHVPADVIRRRFSKGIENFHKTYKALADGWILFDNTDESPRVMETGGRYAL